ncbi:phospholipase/carboxylesterase [Nonomuraea solani]|uniref:Phospholipase/carboxylesterase n=1 Tax=Nonomuraea solani TaxID=1144553 RepID=A0A1H6EQ58_9ACTN|nr:luciferase family protein [Nonomuraea solani]SEH00010.1 phospholipase/carboxylesterase [Nonomuraea solani]
MTVNAGLCALEERPGDRPATSPEIPHQQLDQIAPVELQEELWRRMAGLDHVRTGASVVSLPETRALHLDPGHAFGPDSAFVRDSTEFAHLHGARDGSLHALLPEGEAADIVAKGWGEFHPLVASGHCPPTLLLLYGPRDEEELAVVWRLVCRSHAFASGQIL